MKRLTICLFLLAVLVISCGVLQKPMEVVDNFASQVDDGISRYNEVERQTSNFSLAVDTSLNKRGDIDNSENKYLTADVTKVKVYRQDQAEALAKVRAEQEALKAPEGGHLDLSQQAEQGIGKGLYSALQLYVNIEAPVESIPDTVSLEAMRIKSGIWDYIDSCGRDLNDAVKAYNDWANKINFTTPEGGRVAREVANRLGITNLPARLHGYDGSLPFSEESGPSLPVIPTVAPLFP